MSGNIDEDGDAVNPEVLLDGIISATVVLLVETTLPRNGLDCLV